MAKPLVPELHDIGKLYCLGEMGVELGLSPDTSLHSQARMSALPAKLGLPQPNTNTWRGIVEHHDQHRDSSRKDLFLLVLADHAGSSASRALKDPEERPKHYTVYKLWNHHSQQPLGLPGSRPELRDLVEWLAKDPDATEMSDRYRDLLDSRPEELRPPVNVVSVGSHIALVGKIYRFLDRWVKASSKGGWEFCGMPAASVKVAEGEWRVKLIKAEIGFPQQIVRTRDMALFALMSQQMQELARDDRVLVTAFNQLLAILAPNENVESLFGALLDAGLSISWESAETAIGELGSTPAIRRAAGAAKLSKGIEEIPEGYRPARLLERWRKFDQKYPRGILMPPPPPRFAPPICDLCQMERASAVWPENSDAPGPRENLGPRCYALRQNATRLFRLDRWTEETSTRVAWIFVDLDLDRLVEFLAPLYHDYARHVGLSPELVAQLDVRPPLLAEFQKDYRRFLADFAEAFEKEIGTDNLERVGGEAEGAANMLFCARIESMGQVAVLLRLYLEAVKRYFPVSLERATAASKELAQPFRLAVSVSGVKFPFSEHWRVMRENRADVLVNVVGKGEVRTPLASLPILIEVGRPGHRAALHNLLEVAKVSEALAQAYADIKGEKHYEEYQGLLARMRPLGMTHKSLLAYAKILEE